MKRRAFTLIELLIVVAIMAILSATTLAAFTVPWREQRHASARMEQEFRYGAFLRQLTEDAHNASHAERETDTGAVLLIPADRTEPPIRYQAETDGRIVRTVGAQSNTMLEHATRCEFVATGDTLTVSVLLVETHHDTPSRLERAVTLAFQPAITGGAQ